MLQLHQRFMKFSTTNFRKIFRGIIAESTVIFPKISGKIPQEISQLTALVAGVSRAFICSVCVCVSAF